MGVVLLSQHVEVGVATQLLAEAAERLGYLLKDRVTDAADFAGSLRRVAGGGAALDPKVVSGLLADGGAEGALQSLSPREREVLELVAEGRSNKAIGAPSRCSPTGCPRRDLHARSAGSCPDRDIGCHASGRSGPSVSNPAISSGAVRTADARALGLAPMPA
jgi:hypothetical protein